MGAAVTAEQELTDDDVREALRTMIQQMKESHELMRVVDERMARNRAEREEIKAETRASLARIEKMIDRF